MKGFDISNTRPEGTVVYRQTISPSGESVQHSSKDWASMTEFESEKRSGGKRGKHILTLERLRRESHLLVVAMARCLHLKFRFRGSSIGMLFGEDFIQHSQTRDISTLHTHIGTGRRHPTASYSIPMAMAPMADWAYEGQRAGENGGHLATVIIWLPSQNRDRKL